MSAEPVTTAEAPSPVTARDHTFTACSVCGFAVRQPVAVLSASNAGLYPDSRYPGRVILSLRPHYEHLDEVPAPLAMMFLADVARVSRALRGVPTITRANVSVLGNREPHVHAHIIPRRDTDTNPGKAPWDTDAVNVGLSDEDSAFWHETLSAVLRL